MQPKVPRCAKCIAHKQKCNPSHWPAPAAGQQQSSIDSNLGTATKSEAPSANGTHHAIDSHPAMKVEPSQAPANLNGSAMKAENGVHASVEHHAASLSSDTHAHSTEAIKAESSITPNIATQPTR